MFDSWAWSLAKCNTSVYHMKMPHSVYLWHTHKTPGRNLVTPRRHSPSRAGRTENKRVTENDPKWAKYTKYQLRSEWSQVVITIYYFYNFWQAWNYLQILNFLYNYTALKNGYKRDMIKFNVILYHIMFKRKNFVKEIIGAINKKNKDYAL